MPVSSLKNTSPLEKKLGYSFKNRALLAEALTHKSFHHENPAVAPFYNERLEFLGDSVLGLVIVDSVYRSRPILAESEMSRIKSYLVRGTLLSEMARDLALGDFLLLGKGEEETGGKSKKSILANSLEAIFGAIYLDSGYDAAQTVILQLFRDAIQTVITSGEYHDYKTELQEKSQLLYDELPEYRTVSQDGEEHQKVFTVDVFIAGNRRGSGTGKNKKEAQTAAAKEALAFLRAIE